jgi:hypothetical protein
LADDVRFLDNLELVFSWLQFGCLKISTCHFLWQEEISFHTYSAFPIGSMFAQYISSNHMFVSFSAGIVIEEKNWPPLFPMIHHNISNEIPIHLQKMQYLAFSSFLGKL